VALQENELRYAQDLAKAQSQAGEGLFEDMVGCGFISFPCNDVEGRQVVLVIPENLPGTVLDLSTERLYLYTITLLDAVTDSSYSVLYIHTGALHWQSHPGTLWLRSAYERCSHLLACHAKLPALWGSDGGALNYGLLSFVGLVVFDVCLSRTLYALLQEEWQVQHEGAVGPIHEACSASTLRRCTLVRSGLSSTSRNKQTPWCRKLSRAVQAACEVQDEIASLLCRALGRVPLDVHELRVPLPHPRLLEEGGLHCTH
jgi:hypothetical protein